MLTGRGGDPPSGEIPASHRFILRAYPKWFREEFGVELVEHLAHWNRESRYRSGFPGAARFLWDAGTDALVTGLKLRVERAVEGLATLAQWPMRARPVRLYGGGSGGTEEGGAGAMLERVLREARYGVRSLVKSPGYTAVFVVTLGLGIGVNTAMFTVVNGVLVRPLPNKDGERLVYLRQSAGLAGIANALFSVPEVAAYRTGASSLEAVTEFSALTFTMAGYFDEPRRVRTGIVTGNYFQVLGLSARLGRTLGPEDDGEVAAPVVVVSNSYWRNAMGSDPTVIGKHVGINGRTATLVGVLEPASPYPERTDIYVNLATSPHHLGAAMNHDRSHRMEEVFGRMAPGASVETVRAEVMGIAARLHEEYPEAYDPGSGYTIDVKPLKEQLTSRARPTFLLLLATAGLVFVIACANLTNLTLTRALRRQHELAIRISLGGSRGALRRSLFIENLVLAGAGGATGLFLAALSTRTLVAFAERFTSRAAEIQFDAPVVAITFVAAVLASIFFAFVPRLPDGDHMSDALTQAGTRSTSGMRGRRAQRVLVVAQVAASFVLLIGAGLLLRTMYYLGQVEPGFDVEHVLSMDIPPELEGRTGAAMRSQALAILESVRAVPGVDGAALASAVPLGASADGGTELMEIAVDGFQSPTGAPKPRADFRVVSEGYFATMDIDVLAGREFSSADLEDSQEVVVVNETMARAYFGSRDAIGHQIAWTDDVMKYIGVGKEWRTVVGVVADTRDAGPDADPVHAMYMPYPQVYPGYTGSLVVRATDDPLGVLPSVRKAIRTVDPGQPIDNVRTLAELSSKSTGPHRLNAILLGAFAFLALVIAAVGIGGVLAFSVGNRIREFGIRGALGAGRPRIWVRVVTEGASLAAMGALVGAGIAAALTRFISGLLVGVRGLDPETFLGVGLLLGAVAVAASWGPAWRAAAVSPMEALKHE